MDGVKETAVTKEEYLRDEAAVKSMLLTKQIDWDRRPYKSFDLFLSPPTRRMAICMNVLCQVKKSKEKELSAMWLRNKEKLSKNLWHCVMCVRLVYTVVYTDERGREIRQRSVLRM